MRELRHNVLSGFDSTLIAISSTAPANGFATNTATLVAAVGLSGPGALLFGAIPMFGIALAYFYLNAWRSDAGAAYSWVGRTLNPSLGFFSGWALLVAIVLFMVIGSFPLASATLDLFAPARATDVVAVTSVGFIWFIIVVAIVLLGIKTTAEVQKTLTLLQVAGLLLFVVAAFARGAARPVNHPIVSWWLPIGDNGVHSFVAGALIAIFYFWGWDISSNLTEETVDRKRTPGLSGIAGMLSILALFVASQIAVQLVMTPKEMTDASSNLLVAFAGAALPTPMGHAAFIMASVIILISTVAVLEASLVQAGRTMFAMGRDSVIDERFAALNPRFLTPWNATFALAIVTVAIFFLASAMTSVNEILKEAINAAGIMVAIYYGLSGIACARFYREANKGEPVMWWLRGAWPVASALFVFGVAVAQLSLAGLRADAVVLGLLLSGVIPMMYYRRLYKSSYYKGALEISS